MSEHTLDFAALGLGEPLLAALAELGYESPSPIQAACIPPLLSGRDLLGCAQTGTGKTAAFALPILSRLRLDQPRPQALVLTPTRELAIQVAEAFQKYAHHLHGFHVLPIYGGQSMVLQLRALRRGPQVIVGTPGRIMDHLERKSLDLAGLAMLVLDEADEMLRMGFIDDVEWILEHLPATRQTALFSATMPEPIRRIAARYLNHPEEVRIRSATATVAAIRQKYAKVMERDKLEMLTRILEVEENLAAAIVFVRTKTATIELAERLEARGFSAAALNGDMTQALREQVVERLKGGGLDVVVATDVAARGLDVPRITHVINYDVPYDVETYVHRIGRTGRAGRSGVAILFLAPREMRMLKAIERATRQSIEAISPPTLGSVVERRIRQFKQSVLRALAEEDLEFFSDIVRQWEQEENLSSRQIAAALACLAQAARPLRPAGWPMERDAERKNEQSGEGEGVTAAHQSSKAPHPAADSRLLRYRLAVGRRHGISPRQIVGALANEGGIAGRDIGRVELHEEYAVVELPQLSAQTLARLRRTRIGGQPIAIRLFGDEGDPSRSLRLATLRRGGASRALSGLPRPPGKRLR